MGEKSWSLVLLTLSACAAASSTRPMNPSVDEAASARDAAVRSGTGGETSALVGSGSSSESAGPAPAAGSSAPLDANRCHEEVVQSITALGHPEVMALSRGREILASVEACAVHRGLAGEFRTALFREALHVDPELIAAMRHALVSHHALSDAAAARVPARNVFPARLTCARGGHGMVVDVGPEHCVITAEPSGGVLAIHCVEPGYGGECSGRALAVDLRIGASGETCTSSHVITVENQCGERE